MQQCPVVVFSLCSRTRSMHVVGGDFAGFIQGSYRIIASLTVISLESMSLDKWLDSRSRLQAVES